MIILYDIGTINTIAILSTFFAVEIALTIFFFAR
jgi:hypothetical protein